MLKSFIKSYKNLEKNTYKLMKKGLVFCFFISLISTAILAYYILFNNSPFLFEIGIAIFRLSLVFSLEFVVCGIVVDNIKKKNI